MGHGDTRHIILLPGSVDECFEFGWKAFDIAESAMERAREMGAETCASAAEAAEGMSVIHVIVRNDDQVIDATTGPGGVLEGAAEGARLILHSTILPSTVKEVGEAAAQRGVGVVDAPITGGAYPKMSIAKESAAPPKPQVK